MSKHILVIDDEPDIRDALHFALADVGYKVSSEAQGRAAFAYMEEENRPDVLVMDILLSGENGISVMEELLSLYPSLPVILISADSNFEQSARQAGAKVFLAKPFGVEELLDAVERCLGA